ncbi:MAG: hypothetical protein IH611_10265 [Deltaproteobacteria bacterium]|nr:hypothetical protein [Deltaproteobacteria bacterium]
MTGRRLSAALLLVLSTFLLAACPTVDLSRFGADSDDGSAAGTVAGFGSIRVAGTEFTDNVSTTVEDDRGRGIGAIVAGMVVTVRGTIGASFLSGTAASVAIEREVRGPVDDNGVALDNNTIRVLGQTVLVNPATVIVDADGSGIGLADLKELLDDGRRPGLEVHGGVEDNGTIHAAYIGRVQDNVVADDDVELRGTIKGLDVTARSFRIGAQDVSYMGLPTGGRIDWPETGIANGQVVDVRGYLDAVGGAGTLRTDRAGDRVRVISVDLGNSGDRVALEGYVLSGDASSFGMSVPGGTATVNGGVAPTGDAFGLRKKVRVEGKASGTAGAAVLADSVVVQKAFEILLEGAPEDLSDAGDNTITLLGKTVETDRFTLFRDPSGGVREGFGLATLASGDIVRVVGWLDGSASSGNVEAARVDRIDGTSGRAGLQGPVSSFVDSASLSIVGLTVTTVSADIDYYDKGGVAFANREAFYAKLGALGTGTVVRVRNGVFVSAWSRIDPPSGGDKMEIEIVTINR